MNYKDSSKFQYDPDNQLGWNHLTCYVIGLILIGNIIRILIFYFSWNAFLTDFNIPEIDFIHSIAIVFFISFVKDRPIYKEIFSDLTAISHVLKVHIKSYLFYSSIFLFLSVFI